MVRRDLLRLHHLSLIGQQSGWRRPMRKWSTSFLTVAAGVSAILLVSVHRADSQRNDGPRSPDKPLTIHKSTVIYPKAVARYDDLASLSRASTAIVLGTVNTSHSSV